jgi:hypothetical protein
MTAHRESDVEKYLRAKVKRRCGLIRKVKWMGIDGAPDDFVLLPAYVIERGLRVQPAQCFFAECKGPGETPRHRQLEEHEVLRQYGVRIEVIDSIEQIDALIP